MNRQEDDNNPDTYITDVHKAEEMAYVEDPYQVLMNNAKRAIAAGVKGMDVVLADLKSDADGRSEEVAKEYDERQQQIEDKKASITSNVLEEIKKSASGHVERRGEKRLIGISNSDGNEGQDQWLRKLHTDEFGEIRDVAFALTGIAAPTTYEGYKRTEHRSVSAYNRVFSTSTGLRLREDISWQSDGDLASIPPELPNINGSNYTLTLLPPEVAADPTNTQPDRTGSPQSTSMGEFFKRNF